jgi:hypothetical protein
MDKPDVDPLKCQVVGCNAKWTVSAGWKKCSKHAWTDDKSEPVMKAPTFTQPPVKPFYEIDDREIF